MEWRTKMNARFRNPLLFGLTGIFLVSFATGSRGCTEFRIRAADGTVVIGRTMDFGTPTMSRLRPYSRGGRWAGKGPGSRARIGWTSKYGFVGIDMGGRLAEAVGIDDNLADGMNEE